MFPAGVDFAQLSPKVPGSRARPDFARNDNAWLPMSAERETSLGIACSWSREIIGYFGQHGGIDASRPVALLLEKTVGAHDEIAFCFDGEIQIKGPCRAERTMVIWIDTDLRVCFPRLAGETFRGWAVAGGVPILNDGLKRRLRGG